MTDLWILIYMSCLAFNSFVIYKLNKIIKKLIDHIHSLAHRQQGLDRDLYLLNKLIESKNADLFIKLD